MRDRYLPFQMDVQMALANDVPIEDVRKADLQSAIEGGHSN
jgi:hypothetical protein